MGHVVLRLSRVLGLGGGEGGGGGGRGGGRSTVGGDPRLGTRGEGRQVLSLPLLERPLPAPSHVLHQLREEGALLRGSSACAGRSRQRIARTASTTAPAAPSGRWRAALAVLAAADATASKFIASMAGPSPPKRRAGAHRRAALPQALLVRQDGALLPAARPRDQAEEGGAAAQAGARARRCRLSCSRCGHLVVALGAAHLLLARRGGLPSSARRGRDGRAPRPRAGRGGVEVRRGGGGRGGCSEREEVGKGISV